MTTIFNKLPIVWQETWTKLENNKILQQVLEEMYENGMLEELEPVAFLNGEIEQTFINNCGMTPEQIYRLEKGYRVNIIDLINKVYKELDISFDEYPYNLNRVSDNTIELIFKYLDSNKFIVIEFRHNSNFFVDEVFITKNNLFYGPKHKIIFEIFTSEPCIDFVIRPIIRI
jgi:hypothetical protein